MPYTLYNFCKYRINCRILESWFLTRITAHQNQIEVWNVTEPSWLFRHFLHCLCTISHFHLSSCVTRIEVILLAIIITIDNLLIKILLRLTEQVSEAIFLLLPKTVFLFRGWSTAQHKKGETLNPYKVLLSLMSKYQQRSTWILVRYTCRCATVFTESVSWWPTLLPFVMHPWRLVNEDLVT